ncbi:MAG: hypothetical protein IJR64_07275 [Bacteroidales bacterium]|nr:hypothetical protein [Bacteroidales bacterium]
MQGLSAYHCKNKNDYEKNLRPLAADAMRFLCEADSNYGTETAEDIRGACRGSNDQMGKIGSIV